MKNLKLLALLLVTACSLQVNACFPPKSLEKNIDYKNEKRDIYPPTSLGGLDIDKDEKFDAKDFIDTKKEDATGEESTLFCNDARIIFDCIKEIQKK